jgi:acetylornithine deacetylase
MPTLSPPAWADVDAAIAAEAGAASEFLVRLVAAKSTVGRKAAAQEIVAADLTRLGFEVEHLQIPEATAAAAPAGVAQGSYARRHNLVGWINRGGSPSLLLNCHVDVVPADASQWSPATFTPRTRLSSWPASSAAREPWSGSWPRTTPATA